MLEVIHRGGSLGLIVKAGDVMLNLLQKVRCNFFPVCNVELYCFFERKNDILMSFKRPK